MRYFPPSCFSLLDRFQRGKGKLETRFIASCIASSTSFLDRIDFLYSLCTRPIISKLKLVMRERERQGELQRFEERRWLLLKSLSEANLSFPAFYFRIYPRILGVRESRRNIGQSGPSLNNRSRLRYKAWCLLRFGKVSHSGAENLINRRPEETGSFVLAC